MTKTPQTYAEEYQERIAIKVENQTPEVMAIAQARQEVTAYAIESGVDINKVWDLMNSNLIKK